MNTTTLSPTKRFIVGVQFLFVAFGATVLVPLLVGLEPATALMTAGLGTFIFHFITKGKVPIFLGSSFAFIAPIISASKQWGMPGTLAGLLGVSLVYFMMSALVRWQGKRLLDKLFPPVVIGPVIILIGLYEIYMTIVYFDPLNTFVFMDCSTSRLNDRNQQVGKLITPANKSTCPLHIK